MTRAEDLAVITGAGHSRVGRRLHADPWRLTADAALSAIADAGLDPCDIDGLSTYPGAFWSTPGITGAGVDDVRAMLGLTLRWYTGGGEVPGQLGKSAKAIAFSENPTVLGLPSMHTDHWDPLWEIGQDAGIPVCTHIGSSSRLVTTSADAPPAVLVTLIGLNSMMACADWLLSGTLERFPGLKLILSEGGAEWIPYILERADKAFHDKRIKPNLAIGQTSCGGTIPPSQLFAERVYVCLVDEQFAVRSLADIPVDNLLFEGDYPHGDGLWPNNRKYLENVLAEAPDDDAVKIAETNLRGLLHI
jgi:predicted TIM-barrel fold metal-dependent hydrolase